MTAPTRRFLSYSVVFTTVAMASPLLAQAPPFSGAEKEALGRAAIVGYAANVNAFPFYKCRYSCTTGQAKSVADAVQGKFINAITYEAQLNVDGDKDLYEGLTPPVAPGEKGLPVPGKKGVYVVPAPISSDRYLADGKREMNYCPQLQALGLWSNEKGHHGIARTPLGMHCVEHRNARGPDVLLAKPDRYEMTSDGPGEIDGQPVVTVRFNDKKYMLLTEFSFDLAHGYLPRRVTITSADKHRRTQVFVTAFRECSNQRWFPERSVLVQTSDRSDLYGVCELRVLELDADRRPAATDFAVTVPAGTLVLDGPGTTRKFFKLKQDEKLAIADMPGLFEMLDQSSVSPLMDTAVPHTSPYRWLRWLGGAVGLALALGGVILLVRRRFRRWAA